MKKSLIALNLVAVMLSTSVAVGGVASKVAGAVGIGVAANLATDGVKKAAGIVKEVVTTGEITIDRAPGFINGNKRHYNEPVRTPFGLSPRPDL